MRRISNAVLTLCALLTIYSLVQSTTAAPAKKVAPVVVVQGKIQAIARAPRPRSVPYKDAIIAIHLVNIKPLKGRFSPKQTVVFVWGMRDNKLTPAASFKPGHVIKVALQPWEKVEGKYGGYNRREIDSEEAMSLDPYWGEIQK
ncbi:MAG TPA: hypothetical protein VF600_13585 [Abditibacteriaceae bacterium]|jgi:hypothetical protein